MTRPLKFNKVISPDAGPYFVATDTAGITRVSRCCRAWDGLLQDYMDTPGPAIWSAANVSLYDAELEHERVCEVMRNTGLAGLRHG